MKEDETNRIEYEDSVKKILSEEALPPNVPNLDLPFRCDDDDESWLARPFNFLNAPLVKFINHLVINFCLNKNLIYFIYLYVFHTYLLKGFSHDFYIFICLLHAL